MCTQLLVICYWLLVNRIIGILSIFYIAYERVTIPIVSDL